MLHASLDHGFDQWQQNASGPITPPLIFSMGFEQWHRFGKAWGYKTQVLGRFVWYIGRKMGHLRSCRASWISQQCCV